VRTLLAHSLLALACFCLVVGFQASAATVPSPIGKLSDYAAVFDRHGRDEVSAMIAETSALLHIDVYLLLSWENPYPTVDQFAAAVLAAWNLTAKPVVLAVFVRTGADWAASVAATGTVTAQLGGIAARLEDRMADLVKHRRIEEAVRSMFSELKSLPAAQKALAAQAKSRGSGAARGAGEIPVAVLIGAVVGGVALLAVLIRWRVCPRCAGILFRERRSSSIASRRKRVYLCRRCGYRRG